MKAHLFVLAALLLTPLSANASELPQSAFVVLDSGDLHGRIVEMNPGESLTLVLPNGERTVVPWGKIVRIAVASEQAREQASEQAPGRAAKAEEEGSSAITVTSDTRVQLQAQVLNSDRWETQCFSPCDVVVPTSGLYRIVDESGHPVRTIRLDGRKSVALTVSHSNPIIRGVAVTTTVIGGLFFLGGVSNRSGAVIGVGGVLTGLGIVALLVNRTSVNESAIATRSTSLAPSPAMHVEGERDRARVPFDVASGRTDVAGFTFRF